LYSILDKMGTWESVRENIPSKTRNMLYKSVVRAQNKPKTVDLLSIILLLTGILLLIALFIDKNIENKPMFLISYGYSFFLTPLVLIILNFRGVFSFSVSFTSVNSVARHLIEGMFAGVLLFVLLLQINAIESPLSVKENNPILIVAFALFIPLFEEILYRYLLLSKLLRKASPIMRIIVSSLLFAVAHFPFTNILTFFLYFLTGVILATLFILENFLLPSFVAHCLANFLIFII